jgi:hypothetical protein
LPPKYSAKLDKLSTDAKLEVLSTNILKNKGLVSYYDIAKRTGKSPHTIRIYLKKLNVNPTTKYKQMNYYESGVIKVLEDTFKYGK